MLQIRRMLPLLAPFLLQLLLVGKAVYAMFEDEAGKLDWQTENVGRVTHAAFDAGKLFVGTGAAVVASLDAATGRVEWRRVLQPEDSIDAVLTLRHYALSVSGGGRLARLWSAADGTLMWDALLPAPAGDGAASPASVAAVAATTGAELYISSGGALHVLHPNGALLRSYAPNPSDDKDLAAAVGSDATVRITDVRPRPGGGVFAAGIALRKGRAESLLEFELAGATAAVVVKAGRVARGGLETDQGAMLLAKPGGGYVVAALSAGGKSVAVFDSAGGAVAELDVGAVLGGNAAAVLRALQASGGVLLELAAADGAAAAAISLAAAAGGGWQLSAAAVCSPSDGKECLLAAYSIGDRVTAASASRSSAGSVTVASKEASKAAGGAWSEAVSVSFPLDSADHGAMRHVFLAPAATAGGSVGLLAVSEDDSVALLQGGEQAWVREEALAEVESVDFVDLAADELTVLARQSGEGGSAGTEHHLPDLQERLRLQWLEVRAMGARLLSAVTGQPLPPDLAVLATRDPAEAFGFKKLAVCATSVGRLIALHMDGGAVAWARPLPPLPAGAAAAGAVGPARVFATRPKAVLGYLPEFLVVRPGGGDSGSDGVLTQHDGLTGAETGPATVFKGGLRSVVPLEIFDAEDRRVLMLVDNANRVSVWPPSSEAGAAFAKLLQTSPIFHHHLSSTGLVSLTVVEGTSGDETSFASREVASMALPPDQEVVGVAYRDRRDVIQSPAQALGDESLLLKYLNPHMVAVLTLGPALPGIEGRELTLLLIDTVSARVLQRVAHQGAAGPVHAVVLENRVAYTYWNARARRTELGSVSLFEGVIDRHGLNPLTIPEYKETFSAYEAHAPVTVHRTYIFPHAISALGATVTGQGIAAKNLLVGYGAGQLLSLDSMWIDARRPLGEPNKAEKLEKLPQYQPFLPVIRQHTVSHLRVIERLRDIYAAPAALESTSLVLAVGLDVFGARVAPSKAFDLLSSEFNYAMLMVVLASMAAFNVIASVVVRRKELSARWA